MTAAAGRGLVASSIERGQLVGTHEQRVDQFGRRRDPSDAQFVDEFFELVGAVADQVQARGGRRAFQGVQFTKNGPDQRLIAVGLFQLQQQLAELRDPDTRFLSEQRRGSAPG